jgi:hypothetical protein
MNGDSSSSSNGTTCSATSGALTAAQLRGTIRKCVGSYAGLVVGIRIVGAVYLASLDLDPHGREYLNTGGLTGRSAGFFWTPTQAVWQIPVAILISLLGVAAGLVVLRPRPKQPLGNSTQAA